MVGKNLSLTSIYHCVKSVRIRSFSGPYSVQMQDNRDQKDSKYGHFSSFVCNLHQEAKAKFRNVFPVENLIDKI